MTTTRDTGSRAEIWDLWGKADPARAAAGGRDWHPLVCHALDVVACAEAILRGPRAVRLAYLAAALSLSEDDALPWLLFFVALHDHGKATPGFQAKVPARRAALALAGFDFPDRDEPHGKLSSVLVTGALRDAGVGPGLARWVARTVGGHHGELTSLDELLRLEADKGVLLSAYGGKAPRWRALRGEIASALASACGVAADAPRPTLPETAAARHAFVADLAGLTTTADWLGSNADIFAYAAPPTSAEAYLDEARRLAARALDAAGWRAPPKPSARSFEDLFGKTPWPLHEAVEQMVASLAGPALVVVEAPMGEGKTEAALAIFDALAARGAAGLYFALPTQATSNQIFGRVERFLASAFHGETHGLHLVHGDAGLSERYEVLKGRALTLRSIDGLAGQDQGPVADGWFVRSKRALLAPIAVGTVDQALLGVLGVRHGFLRLHGLAGKVVVVDEVHAYDTYTSTLLDRLLEWLHALGTTVVLLSATLPASRRTGLAAAFGAATLAAAPYPRITVASQGRTRSTTFAGRRPPMQVGLEWKPRAGVPEEIAAAIQDGGCVAWIHNTVRAAQQSFVELCALRDRGALPAGCATDLLHARFPFDERARRERGAEERFGRSSKLRPSAAILVGTQVLEQSLDLDFDLLVTECAPVDLVLQRAGRLHRHMRSARPRNLSAPRLWLVEPEGEERAEGPSFGASAFVYDESILLRSWVALRQHSAVTLPDEIEPLIESVYGAGRATAGDALGSRLGRLDEERAAGERTDADQALLRELPSPEADDPFSVLAKAFDDEDPALHRTLRAMTRLGDPSVEVVPVVERAGRHAVWGAEQMRLDLTGSDALSRAHVVAAARASVAVSHRRIVAALLREAVPRPFAQSGQLRFHRVLILDDGGRATVAGLSMELHRDLGLVVGGLEPGATQEET